MTTPHAADPIILIPARMDARRLPQKPMADIAGRPLIEHVWERACQAALGPVYVATDHEAIFDHIISIGGKAVMTAPTHPSGSDRIYEALSQIDPDGHYQKIINLQGDLPTVTTEAITALARLLEENSCDLATLIAPASAEEAQKPQLVKAVMSFEGDDCLTGRAHYFSRAMVPDGATDYWHHIGLYGWQRSALSRFVSLAPSALEMTEKLEQLRALEAGMIIRAAVIDEAPGGVDTMEDLIAIRATLET